LADENTTGYGAVMMKELWQNFVTRNKRAIAEVQQVELEMAKANLIRTGPTIFPKKPYKLSTKVLFCVFILLLAAAFWAFFKAEIIVRLS
jgi:hypothetical protein